MSIFHIDGAHVIFQGLDGDEEHARKYLNYVETNVKVSIPSATIQSVFVKAASNDEIDISYVAKDTPFERVRRITGYLVGTLDRWNDAKRAEERDRVKHPFGTEEPS